MDLGVDGKKLASWVWILGSGDAREFKHTVGISRPINWEEFQQLFD